MGPFTVAEEPILTMPQYDNKLKSRYNLRKDLISLLIKT